SLLIYKAKAEAGNKYLTIENGLLLYNGRLVILKAEEGKLRTIIIKLYYKTLLTAYLGRNKTRKLIAK
ncbi:hypothetical protein QBC45DRAFT_318517, partial [Copromyces sp. CBS 386.78]